MSKEFFEAIRAGETGKVSAMLQADPGLLGAKDENGMGPFVVAKYSRRNDIAGMLLEKGVELDIFAACMAGAEERVVELVSRHSAISRRAIAQMAGRHCIWRDFSTIPPSPRRC